MIVDRLENAELYKDISPAVIKGLKILKNLDFSKIQPGRYNVEGDNIYYMVQGYVTSAIELGKFESHRKYIDIQYIAKGQELICYANIEDLKSQEQYNQSGDVIFYQQPAKFTPVFLKEGMFCILFPQDAHMPGRQINVSSEVLKVVVKIKCN